MFPSKSNLISGIALTCCLLVAPALFNAAPVQASALIETNKAGVKVDSQAASARKAAQTKALQLVFIKMTGDKTVLDNAGIKLRYARLLSIWCLMNIRPVMASFTM